MSGLPAPKSTAKLDRESATAIAEYLRRKATGGLLSPDPHLPDSEVVTAWARAVPRLAKLLAKAEAGEDVTGAAADILADREPVFRPPMPTGPQPPAQFVALPGPPAAGDRVWDGAEGDYATVQSVDVAKGEAHVVYDAGHDDDTALGDLWQATPPVTVAPGAGPGGSTVVSNVPAGPPAPCPFSVGDRVRHKTGGQVGEVAVVPSGPTVQLAGHTLGDELTVDLDAGGRMVGPVSEWEGE